MIGLLVAAALAGAAVAVVAGIGYGTAAGLSVARLLIPVGVAAVVIAHVVAARRRRLGGLRRQLGVIALIAMVQVAVAVALFVEAMFVSRHDAFFAVLVVAYAGVIAVLVAHHLARRALGDVDAIRSALERVGAGERSVRIPVGGGGELAAIAADVEAMAARLETAEAARRRLIASVSHDLRTPITALRAMAEAISDDVVDAATRDRYTARMAVHVRALSALIDDLFELSRLEAGDISWTLEQVRIDALVEETVEAMRPHADAGAVRVVAELPGRPVPARANPEQLQRVLFNLIQNAIRHTPPDGSVVVRATGGGDAVEVEVADTGDGIAPADRERVFEIFEQGTERASRSNGSAGLGLAIARAIVEAHGGRIWLADAPVGTSVRFRIPAVG